MFGALRRRPPGRAALRRARAHVRRGVPAAAMLGGPMGLNLRLRRLAPQQALDAAALRLLTTLPELDPAAGAEPAPGRPGRVVGAAGRVGGARRSLVSLSTFGYPGMTAVAAEPGRRHRAASTRGCWSPPVPGSTRPTSGSTAGAEVHRCAAARRRDARGDAAGRPTAGTVDDDRARARPAAARRTAATRRRTTGRVGAQHRGGRRRPTSSPRSATDRPRSGRRSRRWSRTDRTGASAARLGAAIRRDRRGHGDGATALEALSRRSSGARSPRGSTVTTARPSQSGEPAQLGRELLGGLRRRAGLGVRRLDDQRPPASCGRP